MEISRREYWCGLPCPYSGDLSNPRTEPMSLSWQADSLPESLGTPILVLYIPQNQMDKHRGGRVGIQLEPECELLSKVLAAPRYTTTHMEKRQILLEQEIDSQVRKSAEKEAQAPIAPTKGTRLKLWWRQKWTPVLTGSCSPFHSLGLSLGGGCPRQDYISQHPLHHGTT